MLPLFTILPNQVPTTSGDGADSSSSGGGGGSSRKHAPSVIKRIHSKVLPKFVDLFVAVDGGGARLNWVALKERRHKSVGAYLSRMVADEDLSWQVKEDLEALLGRIDRAREGITNREEEDR